MRAVRMVPFPSATWTRWPPPRPSWQAQIGNLSIAGLLGGMERTFPNARAVLRHDALGALLAGTLGEPGILLLSGTGSVCLSLGPEGSRLESAVGARCSTMWAAATGSAASDSEGAAGRGRTG